MLDGIMYFADIHAKFLAQRGFFVLICDAEKKPNSKLAPNGYLSATNDMNTIATWRVPEKSTVGIACKQSGIIVFDCDIKRGTDGVRAFLEIARQQNIDLSQVPLVRTPSGGMHYYFRLPENFSHGNGTGSLPDGIDVRCAGYVLAPDCLVIGKGSYKLLKGELTNIPFLPLALQTLLKASKREASLHPQGVGQNQSHLSESLNPPVIPKHSYVQAILSEEKETLSNSPSGQRNDQLFKSTASLFSCVASNWIEHETVESAMWEACQANGLIADDGPSAFYKTFNSAIRHGASQPRQLLSLPRNDVGLILNNVCVDVFWHGKTSTNAFSKELIKGLLPGTGVAVIAGQSGAGKTFIALWLATCVALGLPFFGNKPRQRVGTILLLGEGASTISDRLEAIMQSDAVKNSSMPFSNLPVAWRSFNAAFSDHNEYQSISDVIKEVKAKMLQDFGVSLGLIVVDTLAAAFQLADENDAGEATRIMTFLHRLSTDTNTLVVPIAHYGKSAETGLRGSSAYTASSDVILAVHAKRNESGEVTARHLGVAKSRNYETGWKRGFLLQQVPVGLDEDGDTKWSCFVAPQDTTMNFAHNKLPLKLRSASLIRLLSVFDEVVSSEGTVISPSVNQKDVIAVPFQTLRKVFNVSYPAEGDTEEKRADNKRKQWKRSFDAALKNDDLGFSNIDGREWVWRCL